MRTIQKFSLGRKKVSTMNKDKHSESMHHPDPLPGESSSAYRAFCYFCDEGKGRTLTQAWRSYSEHCNSANEQTEPHRAKRMTRCPGQWTRWSTQFRWLERATAYDRGIADRRRAKRAEQRDALEEQRFEYERQSQAQLEDRYDRIGGTLDKYHAAPVTDITQEKDEVIDGKRIQSVTRVKGARGGDFAAVLKEQSHYRRQAIFGFREKASSVVEIPKADHVFWRSTKKVA